MKKKMNTLKMQLKSKKITKNKSNMDNRKLKTIKIQKNNNLK